MQVTAQEKHQLALQFFVLPSYSVLCSHSTLLVVCPYSASSSLVKSVSKKSFSALYRAPFLLHPLSSTLFYAPLSLYLFFCLLLPPSSIIIFHASSHTYFLLRSITVIQYFTANSRWSLVSSFRAHTRRTLHRYNAVSPTADTTKTIHAQSAVLSWWTVHSKSKMPLALIPPSRLYPQHARLKRSPTLRPRLHHAHSIQYASLVSQLHARSIYNTVPVSNSCSSRANSTSSSRLHRCPTATIQDSHIFLPLISLVCSCFP